MPAADVDLTLMISRGSKLGRGKTTTTSSHVPHVARSLRRRLHLAGLTLALVATVGWIGLLGYVAIKLL